MQPTEPENVPQWVFRSIYAIGRCVMDKRMQASLAESARKLNRSFASALLALNRVYQAAHFERHDVTIICETAH
jgi:hypothetical protein